MTQILVSDLDGVIFDNSLRIDKLLSDYKTKTDFFEAFFRGEKKELIDINRDYLNKFLKEKSKFHKPKVIVLTGTVFLDKKYEDFVRKELDRYLKDYELISKPETLRYAPTSFWKFKVLKELSQDPEVEIVFFASDDPEETSLISPLLKNPKKEIWTYKALNGEIHSIFVLKKENGR